MNMLDLIIVVLVAGGVFRGYRRGFILEVAALAGVFLALFLAYQFRDEMAPVLQQVVPLPKDVSGNALVSFFKVEEAIYSVMAFVVVFFGVKLLLSLGASLLTSVARLPVLNKINQIGGAGVALIKVVLVLMIFINLMHLLPMETSRQAVENSALSQGILSMTPDMKEILKELVSPSQSA
ncbi:membrane protein [Marinithermofilum abyssi]|uniref:Membrane protein n=1 Tax=Marinithermofilum abyssi TaxID=1571185 RepID=A0A8J2YCP3_9BACL|nr:CvpA family protein [Marinithermofilum abyssi]GGE17822.1 membrane protein [Marinithermofilum abyssi]